MVQREQRCFWQMFSVSFSLSLSLCLCLSLSLSLCPSVSLWLSLALCPSLWPSVSVCPSVPLSVSVSMSLSLSLSRSLWLSVSLSLSLSVPLSLCPSVSLSLSFARSLSKAEASPNRAVTFDGASDPLGCSLLHRFGCAKHAFQVLCNSSKTTLQGASFEDLRCPYLQFQCRGTKENGHSGCKLVVCGGSG